MASEADAMSIYDDRGSVLMDPLMAILGVFTMDKSYEWLNGPEVGD